MGWALGVDASGKEIGYAVEATCEHTGCDAAIVRDVDSACGGEHGETDLFCNGYFCNDHMPCVIGDEHGHYISVCVPCGLKAALMVAQKILPEVKKLPWATGMAIDKRSATVMVFVKNDKDPDDAHSEWLDSDRESEINGIEIEFVPTPDYI